MTRRTHWPAIVDRFIVSSIWTLCLVVHCGSFQGEKRANACFTAGDIGNRMPAT
jgi:hypothetical protein